MNQRQIDNLRLRTAELAVGASTVRGAGAPGTVAAARRALKAVPLRSFAVRSRRQFRAILERHTRNVQSRLPPNARHWGVARKVLNIFLRSCVYSRPLARAYGITHIEQWLELPLDSQIARGIRTCSGAPVPRWRTVKGVSPGTQAQYQAAAEALARKLRVRRIHLEACWWRETISHCACAV